MSSETRDLFFSEVNTCTKLMLYTNFPLFFKYPTEDKVSIFFFNLDLLNMPVECNTLEKVKLAETMMENSFLTAVSFLMCSKK